MYCGNADSQYFASEARAADPNVTVDWTIERDGHLRMMGSTNTRVSDTDPNHVVLAAFAYQRRTLGLPTRETLTRFDDADPNGATRTFEYDRLYRLTGVDYPQGPNEAFAYDQAGNRITYQDRLGQTTTYDPNYTNLANQYGKISPGTSDPNYDAAGNMTSDHRGYEYVYDGDNRLWRVWKDDVLQVQYIKDALGRRIRKEDFIRGTTTRYLWSGQNVVAEYDGEYERLRYYVHGPTYIDERVVMHDEATDRDYVYLMKDLYTVAGLADRQGWPVESYDYDAYGRVWMRRCAMLPWAADLDGDGDVDANDHAIFEDHYAGSGEEPNGVAGWRSDLDCDGDVDGSDYVWFAHAYNGDGQTPRGDLSLLTASTAESQVGNAYFFTGRRLDVLDIDDANTPHHFTDDQPKLTLFYYRARTMEPVLGRFGQRDPLGIPMPRVLHNSSMESWDMQLRPHLQYADGASLYDYVRSTPTASVDPLGLLQTVYGEICSIKVCRRWLEVPVPNSGMPPFGHTWIEIGGMTYDYPSTYPTYHNGFTSCDEARAIEGATVNVPGYGRVPGHCMSCEAYKRCIAQEMADINVACDYRLVPDGGGLHNCISAKNEVLRRCGLTGGLSSRTPRPNPPGYIYGVPGAW